MAIDFSQVKTITIPEGDVKSISIGGVAVWQHQQEPEWHTIWEGSVSDTLSAFAYTAAGTGKTPQIRVTFNDINASGGTVRYTVNSSTSSSIPTSPKDMTLKQSSNIIVIGARADDTSSHETASAVLTKNNVSANNNVLFSFSKIHTDPNNMNQCSASLTITKIEQYY